MKKLILALCLFTATVQGALPIFFGSTFDYVTNTGPSILFVYSNRIVMTFTRGNGTLTLPYDVVIGNTNLIASLANLDQNKMNYSAILSNLVNGPAAITNTGSGYGITPESVIPAKFALTNQIVNVASNATTAQIDFATSDNTYEVTNLNVNITLQLTNLTRGRDKWVYVRTDGTSRTVTVSTNGMTSGTRVTWGNCTTNGGTVCTVTNRARFNFACVPLGEISSSYELQQ